MPSTTFWVIVVCVVVFGVDSAFPGMIRRVCLHPRSVLWLGEVWRMAFAPFFHASLLHLLMNMIFLAQLAQQLEKNLFGSFQYASLQLLLMITSGLLHVLLNGGLELLHLPSGWESCSIGYSGVLFGLLTILCHSQEHDKSFFGFQIPSKVYPWLLIAFAQLLVPHASMSGHLSGILAAYLYMYHVTSWLLPPPSLIQRFEASSWRFARLIADQSSYVYCPFSSLPTTQKDSIVDSWRTFFTRPRHVQPSLPALPPLSPAVSLTPAPKTFTGRGFRLSDPVNPHERAIITDGFPPDPEVATIHPSRGFVKLPERGDPTSHT